jgi:hypothetical protein
MYGQLSNMKIDNMWMEHREKLFHENKDGSWSEIKTEVNGAAEMTPTYSAGDDIPLGDKVELTDVAEEVSQGPRKDVGFVTVCAGSGLADIFRGLGVDYVIEGGQTMNPSTADILDAVAKVNADTVIVLPNNKNIILAANQAAIMSEDSEDGKKIVVVPSKTVPQGITAIINYIPDAGLDDNISSMNDSLGTVSTGEVTYAVRDTVIDDVTIKQGDYMGIGDKGILGVGSDIADVTFDMLEKMMNDDRELISVYYGDEVSEQDANSLRDRISSRFPDCDVELQFGGQPIYYYIVSAE